MRRLLMLGLLIGAISGCGRTTPEPAPVDTPKPSPPATPAERSAQAKETAKHIASPGRCKKPKDEEFSALLHETTEPIVVCFYSPAVPESTALLPMMEELAGQYAERVTAVLVDIDASPLTTTRWRVETAPTVIAFRQGHPVEIRTGRVQRSDLEAVFTLVSMP